MLTTREQARIQVLNGVTTGEATVGVAAGLVGGASAMRGDCWQPTGRRGYLPWLTATGEKLDVIG